MQEVYDGQSVVKGLPERVNADKSDEYMLCVCETISDDTLYICTHIQCIYVHTLNSMLSFAGKMYLRERCDISLPDITSSR